MEKIQESKQHKRKKKKFFKFLPICLGIISLFTLFLIYQLDVLPFQYFLLILGGFFVLNLLMFYLIWGRGWKKRFIGTIFSSILMVGMVIFCFYLGHTFDFLKKIQGKNYNTENYSVIVLKNSSYKKIKELENKKIGLFKIEEEETGLTRLKEHLEKKVKGSYVEEEDLDSLVDDLLSKKVSAIVLEDSKKRILEEEHSDFLGVEKVLYQFSVDIPIEDNLVKDVAITENAFNIFISGIDSYGKISSVSRSDVNMVLTVNPVTHKVLMTSIPRDYYVRLGGIVTNYKDKLTHAGMHGIETSVKTVENLLGIDINYYVKINFTSLVDLVNELGGIDVVVDKPFRAFYNENGEVINYSFKKGTNHLNGKQALAFARERKSLPLGDVTRVEHQQLILQALFDKVLSKGVITKYNDILNTLSGKFVTNMGTQNITALIKNQIKNNFSWEFSKNVLEGSDAYEYTYSYKKRKTYVMEPDLKSVDQAKNLIRSVVEE